MVELLVKRGAKIDAEDAQGCSASFYAQRLDDQSIISSLESAPPVATWDISESLGRNDVFKRNCEKKNRWLIIAKSKFKQFYLVDPKDD